MMALVVGPLLFQIGGNVSDIPGVIVFEWLPKSLRRRIAYPGRELVGVHPVLNSLQDRILGYLCHLDHGSRSTCACTDRARGSHRVMPICSPAAGDQSAIQDFARGG